MVYMENLLALHVKVSYGLLPLTIDKAVQVHELRFFALPLLLEAVALREPAALAVGALLWRCLAQADIGYKRGVVATFLLKDHTHQHLLVVVVLTLTTVELLEVYGRVICVV